MLKRISFGKPKKESMLTVTSRKGAMIKEIPLVISFVGKTGGFEECCGASSFPTFRMIERIHFPLHTTQWVRMFW